MREGGCRLSHCSFSLSARLVSCVDQSPPSTALKCLLSTFNAQVNLHPLVVLLQNAVVLAQGMPLPTLGQQNPLHVRLSVKLDAKHVADFAFHPVRRRPYRTRAWNTLAIPGLGLNRGSLVPGIRIKH